MSGQHWDVFISYAHEDGEWVEALAENLRQLGLEVFKDDWKIDAGDGLVTEIQKAIDASKSGVLVVTPAALSRPWVLAEYDAMMTLAIEKGFRLIPVLLADADMPTLLAARVWIDFRDAYGPEYEKKVRDLAHLLKGEKRKRPPGTGGIVPPRGDGLRPEGPIHRTLRIGKERVEFVGGWKTASHRPRGIGAEDENRLYELEQLRHGDAVYREKDAAVSAAGLRRVDRIIVSGRSVKERLQRAGRTRPFGFILKPFRNKDLKVNIEMALCVSRAYAERKRADGALSKSEAFLHETGEKAKVGRLGDRSGVDEWSLYANAVEAMEGKEGVLTVGVETIVIEPGREVRNGKLKPGPHEAFNRGYGLVRSPWAAMHQCF